MNSFRDRLKQIMDERNISQSELSRRTKIGRNSISDYLNGKYEAKQDKVYELAKVLNVNEAWLMGFNIDKKREIDNDITSIYNKLTPPRQQNVLNYAHGQLEEQNAKNDNVIQMVTLSRIHASAAGVVGEELFDDIYEEEVEFEADKVPKGADYCVLVNGDSMEPMIRDGSCAFIKKTDTVADGTIALVIVDGAGYIKRVDIYDNVIRLVSLNPKYEDIIVQSHHDMKVCGKVVL
ncbi:helix-turn-helix domain-containing protein [Staphylococcus chromogenes]|uniref:LexA family transcriptional regulator n=1 Tax=Staphylococcus chromogenes TaxID=46126 RepID=UPI0014047F5A|nr:LexA family transcriptional regulator [Staphylococcus chromogenes]QIN26353.1 helix-turn-helix domain-containing protein [Staphylococcus chromogenes]